MKPLYLRRQSRGFTLIEMMVSIALFSIVMSIVGVAYLNLINLDRTTRATSDVINNLNYAIDSMSRSLRTGTGYECNGLTGGDSNCWPPSSDPGTSITFTNDQNVLITYLLNTTTNQIEECTGTNAGGNCNVNTATNITDPRISVTTLNFYVRGVDTGNTDATQPEVIVVIGGSVSTDSSKPPVTFNIQTAASERGIDI